MEEVGDRTILFEIGGLHDRQRASIDGVLRASLEEGVEPGEVITDEAAILLAARLKTPLQLSRYLVRAFEAGFEIGAKPIHEKRRYATSSTPSPPRSASSCAASWKVHARTNSPTRCASARRSPAGAADPDVRQRSAD